MGKPDGTPVTVLLEHAGGGDQAAADRLLPLVYEQLRAIAAQAMASERRDHTLQATALVHEAYLRLVGEREIPWANRAHFYAAAAEAVRRILLDHAKGRLRVKRGGGRVRVDLAGVADLASENPGGIVAFDEAFRRLEDEAPEAAAVVRMRFWAGLSAEETADALGLSLRTVHRRWSLARAWLSRHLGVMEGSDEPRARDL